MLLENIHPVAAAAFRRAGWEVDVRSSSLSEDELIAELPGVSVLGIRSNTTVTPAVLEAGKDLLAVGCFCIGTNQVHLESAADRGLAVFNAPFSNTRSVVELVLGEIVALARRLTEKTQRMHEGVWDKSAKGSHEVRGRTLGIVGYGNIGTQLSNVAEAIGMRVIFFDTADRLAHGNARLFGAERFAMMKPGAVFINASRGMVVDDAALRDHIRSGHLSGAAIDVFPLEPKAQGDPFDSPLRGLDNVILTPHVGGSTQEAQEEIGHFVANKLLGFVDAGSTALSVNLPQVSPPQPQGAFRMGYLHENLPGVLADINRVLADSGVNVVGQSLSTRSGHGYVLTDTDTLLSDATLSVLRQSPHTVWLRSWRL